MTSRHWIVAALLGLGSILGFWLFLLGFAVAGVYPPAGLDITAVNAENFETTIVPAGERLLFLQEFVVGPVLILLSALMFAWLGVPISAARSALGVLPLAWLVYFSPLRGLIVMLCFTGLHLATHHWCASRLRGKVARGA